MSSQTVWAPAEQYSMQIRERTCRVRKPPTSKSASRRMRAKTPERMRTALSSDSAVRPFAKERIYSTICSFPMVLLGKESSQTRPSRMIDPFVKPTCTPTAIVSPGASLPCAWRAGARRHEQAIGVHTRDELARRDARGGVQGVGFPPFSLSISTIRRTPGAGSSGIPTCLARQPWEWNHARRRLPDERNASSKTSTVRSSIRRYI